MLSKKAKYGIRALIHLACRGRGHVLIKDIAEAERIPRKFLEAILLDLKLAGLLQSRPGRGGGYSLRRPADSINLGQVIRTFDGPLAPIPCASQTAFTPCLDCPDVQQCVIRLVMRQVRDATAAILDQTTLDQLAREQDRLSAPPFHPDFNI
jgi:Rrf2 family protein